MDIKHPIKSFRDLHVYQNSYQAMLQVSKEVLPKLPSREKFDLTDQLSRSTKAIPRLIAEGYSKRHQNFGFQKYLDDALAESNETIVSLEQSRDLYNLEAPIINELIDIYDKCSRQLYKLRQSWSNFKTSHDNLKRNEPRNR